MGYSAKLNECTLFWGVGSIMDWGVFWGPADGAWGQKSLHFIRKASEVT